MWRWSHQEYCEPDATECRRSDCPGLGDKVFTVCFRSSAEPSDTASILGVYNGIIFVYLLLPFYGMEDEKLSCCPASRLCSSESLPANRVEIRSSLFRFLFFEARMWRTRVNDDLNSDDDCCLVMTDWIGSEGRSSLLPPLRGSVWREKKKGEV